LASLLGSRQLSERNGPTAGFDIVSLRDEGWTEYPFRQFVLKIHSRCNLSCAYCYVYEMADQSWRDKPQIISLSTLKQVALRIAEHATVHQLPAVELILHGGEPLLCGESFIRATVALLRKSVPAETGLSVRLQTNGTLLTQRMLAMLYEHDIKVGVSVDGTAQTHDARRRYANGRGSYHLVSAALRRLAAEPYSAIYSGILSTVDVSADPIETYESLVEFAPPRIDFLLPHANWSVPPPKAHAVRYGEWLAEVFDRWYGRRTPETQVRLFEEIIHLLLGGHSSSEMIGLSPVALIVVDTDGSIEQVDTLKSAFAGAPNTGMNVFAHSFDDVLTHPAIVARQIGDRALSDICRTCPVGKVCGGGYYPHRYSPREGFRNPSVYCGGLRHLIEHIARRIRTDLQGRSAC
jgi:uncharacterized protein